MIEKAPQTQVVVNRLRTDPLLRGADAALRRAALKAQERARIVAAAERAAKTPAK